MECKDGDILIWKAGHNYVKEDITLFENTEYIVGETVDKELAIHIINGFPEHWFELKPKDGRSGFHKCKECGEEFDTPQGLGSHMNKHEAEIKFNREPKKKATKKKATKKKKVTAKKIK